MSGFQLRSSSQQVAAHLREELRRGRWTGKMPGRDLLAAELGVGGKVMVTALMQLEREGWLENQGPRCRRRILLPDGDGSSRPLRVAILTYEPRERAERALIGELQHLLTEEGHMAFFAEKSLLELGMKVPHVQLLVERTQADAWVACVGSREVLEWFAARPEPCFALFGRREGLPIASAGPDILPPFISAIRRLIALGHERIVNLTRAERRHPEPGQLERAFLAELEAHGISPSSYNLPDWEESSEGLHACLERLFLHTPPTALIIDEAPLLVAVLQFCAARGLRVLQDVSLVCADSDPAFGWCRPPIAHIHWDSRPVARRIVRWVANVSRGRRDMRQTLTRAEFVEGGTVGPAPGKR